MKLGRGDSVWHRFNSSRQMFIVCRSRAASSLTPSGGRLLGSGNRVKRTDRAAVDRRTAGGAFRSAFRSSNVELRKIRKILLVVGMIQSPFGPNRWSPEAPDLIGGGLQTRSQCVRVTHSYPPPNSTPYSRPSSVSLATACSCERPICISNPP